MNRAVAYVGLGWDARASPRHNGFQPLHRFFVRRAANIPGSVIVIVREKPGGFAVPEHTCGPIALVSLRRVVSPDRPNSGFSCNGGSGLLRSVSIPPP